MIAASSGLQSGKKKVCSWQITSFRCAAILYPLPTAQRAWQRVERNVYEFMFLDPPLHSWWGIASLLSQVSCFNLWGDGDRMALTDITRPSVEAALAEAEAIGQEAFLTKYGFGPARSYFVEWNGERYDSKAIAGAAHGYLLGGAALAASEFSRAESSVASQLRQLGFTVSEPPARNPAWTRDELILALDLYVRFTGNPPDKGSKEIVALSALLNRIAGGLEGGAVTFRNPNGVYMKLMNFRRFDPVYQARGKSGLTRGNKLEEVVWNDFASDPARTRQHCGSNSSQCRGRLYCH